MIRKGYIVQCDSCNTTAKTFWVSDSEEGARKVARIRGWVTRGDDDLCRLCASEVAE